MYKVQGAVMTFIDEYLPGNTQKTIGCILKTVDKSIASKHQEVSDRMYSESNTYNSETIKELESLQAENQALKAHLLSQLEEVKKENDHLKQTLDTLRSSQSSHDEQVAILLKEIEELKGRLEASNTSQGSVQLVRSDQTKAFNSLPKNLKDFYNQMEHGSEELPKFSELTDFKTNKSTKATYCKRKAIFSFIKTYSGGVDECLRVYEHISPLQLYEQCIKKSRQAS